MKRFNLLILSIFVYSILLSGLNCSDKKAEQWSPTFIHSKVAITLGGFHSTTRGTIRLVFPFQGKWLVFRGDPNTYHFSEDGIRWSSNEALQVSRSHLIKGNTIYTVFSLTFFD